MLGNIFVFLLSLKASGFVALPLLAQAALTPRQQGKDSKKPQLKTKSSPVAPNKAGNCSTLHHGAPQAFASQRVIPLGFLWEAKII